MIISDYSFKLNCCIMFVFRSLADLESNVVLITSTLLAGTVMLK